MRAAIYFTPAKDDPLTLRAANWLGRDAFDNRIVREPDPMVDALVSDSARYGFHATLKAPFRLADGKTLNDLDRELAAFSQRMQAFSLGKLAVTRLSRFFALTVQTTLPEMLEIEEAVRTAFEPFRAPLTEQELARRNPQSLSERQKMNLSRWGYPYVGQDFRFHMTLTNSISVEDEAVRIEKRLHSQFSPVLETPVAIDALALFVEPRPGAPFYVHSRYPLQGGMPSYS
jgi:putative phosphonate metabolism protein